VTEGLEIIVEQNVCKNEFELVYREEAARRGY
jgi:hypothetical protein